MGALDRHLPDFDANEVHEITLEASPEAALKSVLAVPAGSDPLVRMLFRLRRVPGAELPLERFATEILRLELVERSATRAVATGRLRGLHLGISFEGEALDGGSRLVTETRVADATTAFRLYWLVIRPFSGLIRRRWLHAARRRCEARTSSRMPSRRGRGS